MRIAASHGGELIARPLIGALQVRRSRQPRPDSVCQGRGKLHHVRMQKPLVANALVHREIQILGGGLRQIVRGFVRLIGFRVFRFLISRRYRKTKAQQQRESGTQ